MRTSFDRGAVPEAAAPRWRSRRLRDAVLIGVLLASRALVVVASVSAVAGLVSPQGDGMFGIDGRCEDAPFSCGIAAGVLISVVPIVVAVLTLLLWRLRRVGGQYLQRARDHAEELVEVAHPPDHVVGRDGLCGVIQENLAAREARRPHLLVGGVGDGKTAVLLHLTRLLAANRNDAIPVPVRLRDAQSVLDFEELARRRFLREVERWLVSDAEGDKIWRKLREQDRIIVLADGLEEALSAGDAVRSRDTAIRLAFDAAKEKRLPLVVTSRHHDAVRYADVAMLRPDFHGARAGSARAWAPAGP